MTLPACEKTWQFDVNNPVGGTGAYQTDFRLLMMNLVKTLVEMPINPWLVMGSSDGSTAGMDGVNRWAPLGVWDYTKLVWAVAGSAHSWIVLRQPGLFSLCELCIDCSNASYYNMTSVWGFTGFTGGTTTNRPTATTSITLTNNTSWFIGSNSVFSTYVHGMQSTDGECTRLTVFNNGVPTLFWIFDRVKNPPATGWADPVVMATTHNSSISAYTATYLNRNARLTGRIGSTTASLYMTGEGYGTTLNTEVQALARLNQLSGDMPFYPVGLASETTGVKGRHGELFDIWWGVAGVATGTPDATWPDDSTRKFWQPDHIILPWDGLVTPPGSVPLVRY